MTREATSIGAGLDPVRAARPIRRGERIHVIGVAGAGASAAALLGRAAGADMDGCDPGSPSPYTLALEAAGIPVAPAHDPRHVTAGPRPDRLAVTKALTAVDPDHPELRAARDRGIPVEGWQQVVADAAAGRQLIAIAGTHGKSTSAGWLTHVLVEAGLDPAAFVGALLPSSVTGGAPATARVGNGDAFVVEADEYAGNFDAYVPDIAVLTSAEWDHPDVFADAAAVEGAFEGWLAGMAERATLIANVGDAGVARIVERLSAAGRPTVVPFALSDGGATPSGVVGRVVAVEPSGTTLEIRGLDEGTIVARLPTAGRHNAANALGVAAAARHVGVPPDRIARALETFPGVGRRLERLGEARGVAVYDDYGHHPTAIRATVEAVRQREPGRRVWAVYEPLTYHRTAALLEPFATALATADAAVVADIWAGRDLDRSVASATELAEAVTRARPDLTVAAPGDVEETAAWLAGEVRDGEVVLVMGGGLSYQIGRRLLERLEEAG